MTRECHNSTEIKNRDILIKISRPTQGKVKHDDACQARHNPSREHVKNFPRIKRRDSHKRRQPLYKFYKSARQESKHKAKHSQAKSQATPRSRKGNKVHLKILQQISDVASRNASHNWHGQNYQEQRRNIPKCVTQKQSKAKMPSTKPSTEPSTNKLCGAARDINSQNNLRGVNRKINSQNNSCGVVRVYIFASTVHNKVCGVN